MSRADCTSPPVAGALAWAADAAVVLAFIALGRRSHDEDGGGVLATALPFLAALQTGWLLRAGMPAASFGAGLIVWGVTAAGGLALRVATGDTAAAGFVVVTALVLAVGFLGWRLLVRGARVLRRRRRTRDGAERA